MSDTTLPSDEDLDKFIDSIITRETHKGSVNRIRLEFKERVAKALHEAEVRAQQPAIDWFWGKTQEVWFNRPDDESTRAERLLKKSIAKMLATLTAEKFSTAPRDTPLQCPDCAVWPGFSHKTECDVARCTICGSQAVSCDHLDSEEGKSAVWLGSWPGVQECLEYGILKSDGTPDLNRFMMFICPAGAPLLRKHGCLYWSSTHNRYISDDPARLRGMSQAPAERSNAENNDASQHIEPTKDEELRQGANQIYAEKEKKAAVISPLT